MKGFSLIELMVVIAIVAVLSSVAVPAYDQYITKAKIGSVLPVIGDVAERLISYYETNGTYATSFDQIGITPGSTPLNTADPSSVTEYYAQPYLASLSSNVTQTAGQCDQLRVSAVISNYNSNNPYTSSAEAPTFTVYDIDYYNTPTDWQSVCAYVSYSGSDTSPYDLNDNISGCYNEPSQSAAWQAAESALAAECS